MTERYRLLDEGSLLGAIGKGSFGKVYVAVDLRTSTSVAVKRQQLPSTNASRELCFYKALSQERHDHVMLLLDHFIVATADRSFLYMVFEFMDTTLWNTWTLRRRVLPPRDDSQIHRPLSLWRGPPT